MENRIYKPSFIGFFIKWLIWTGIGFLGISLSVVAVLVNFYPDLSKTILIILALILSMILTSIIFIVKVRKIKITDNSLFITSGLNTYEYPLNTLDYKSQAHTGDNFSWSLTIREDKSMKIFDCNLFSEKQYIEIINQLENVEKTEKKEEDFEINLPYTCSFNIPDNKNLIIIRNILILVFGLFLLIYNWKFLIILSIMILGVYYMEKERKEKEAKEEGLIKEEPLVGFTADENNLRFNNDVFDWNNIEKINTTSLSYTAKKIINIKLKDKGLYRYVLEIESLNPGQMLGEEKGLLDSMKETDDSKYNIIVEILKSKSIKYPYKFEYDL